MKVNKKSFQVKNHSTPQNVTKVLAAVKKMKVDLEASKKVLLSQLQEAKEVGSDNNTFHFSVQIMIGVTQTVQRRKT